MPSSSLFLGSCTTFITFLLTFTLSVFAVPFDLETRATTYTYKLDTEYSGQTFFDGFDFFSDADPTHGFVTYRNRNDAMKNYNAYYAMVSNAVHAIMVPDYQNKYNPNGAGRPSVRIESKKSWTQGLWIADINHMPSTTRKGYEGCSTWPAFWTLGSGTWPYNGEIDIIEGVNNQVGASSFYHTGYTCKTDQKGLSSAKAGGTDCQIYYQNNQYLNTGGCGTTNTNSKSYGKPFNDNAGGVYAMQWTGDFVKTWFFQRNGIPANIQSGKPDPSTWGNPFSVVQGGCNIGQNFNSHRIVFDTTFCGDWAGATFANQCGGLGSCASYVANNPGDFAEAYWAIKSVKVYTTGATFRTNFKTNSTTTSTTQSSSTMSTRSSSMTSSQSTSMSSSQSTSMSSSRSTSMSSSSSSSKATSMSTSHSVSSTITTSHSSSRSSSATISTSHNSTTASSTQSVHKRWDYTDYTRPHYTTDEHGCGPDEEWVTYDLTDAPYYPTRSASYHYPGYTTRPHNSYYPPPPSGGSSRAGSHYLPKSTGAWDHSSNSGPAPTSKPKPKTDDFPWDGYDEHELTITIPTTWCEPCEKGLCTYTTHLVTTHCGCTATPLPKIPTKITTIYPDKGWPVTTPYVVTMPDTDKFPTPPPPPEEEKDDKCAGCGAAGPPSTVQGAAKTVYVQPVYETSSSPTTSAPTTAAKVSPYVAPVSTYLGAAPATERRPNGLGALVVAVLGAFFALL